MPLNPRVAAATAARLAAPVALSLTALLLWAAWEAAFAQTSPFGGPRPPAQALPPADGIVGWIMVKQAEFYRGLSAALRAAKADGSAVIGLFTLSFAYGIFHAAGPGHGKAVISSYLVANEETWKRGVVLSFASAMLQALVAVAIVTVAAILLNVTAKRMGDAVRIIEIASYTLIILLGARLLWVKGRGFIAALRGSDAHAPRPAHARHHGHTHSHDEGAACDHTHAPEPKALAGPGGWRRGLTAVIAVGARPCSGAILVLVFALAQGLFWVGVVSTFIMGLGTAITVAAIATLAVSAKSLAKRFATGRPGAGTLVLRGIEVVGAGLVLAFGALLLTGYMASERIGMF
jgi:ABC-type nickel/cobalt efflux system permease component RcnA